VFALLTNWGLLGIALVYALEAFGVPVPIEIPLWLSGQMMHQGLASYPTVVMYTWGGTLLGNALAFSLARSVGDRLLSYLSTRLGMKAQAEKVHRWVDRYGLGAVLLTRWINWGYAPSLWLAGVSGLPVSRTLTAIAINTGLWSCAWVFVGRTLIGGMSGAGLPSWLLLLPPIISVSGLATWRLIRTLQKRNQFN
jgi:membrane protein DedA with SNARE-associated domain